MEAEPLRQSQPEGPGPWRSLDWLHAVLAMAAGGLLRVWMLSRYFQVSEDSLLYGEMARNLLLHGRYALTGAGGVLQPTLIRLPGYPLLLAACFRIFGMELYGSVAEVQIALELLGCLLLADVARRVAPHGIAQRAGRLTLWLAALCPFTAVYAAQPLTEAPTLFTIALALWAAARFQTRPGWAPALYFTGAVSYAALLRPDGALVAVAVAPALIFGGHVALRQRVKMAVVCLLLAATPFAVWAVRNWEVFHVVQPLAPRSATDPGSPVYPGWEAWVSTWTLDFVSTYSVYWNVPGEPLDVDLLPARAFDTPAQRAETAALADEYNRNGYNLTASIDAGLARLAAERRAAHPWRTDLLLPLGRMLDMWVRPRVEVLPIDLDWWVYAHHHVETEISWFYVALNAGYLLLGALGLWLRPRLWGCMLAYFVLRSALLLTVHAPEARYTLECFPMLFVLDGVALGAAMQRVRARRRGFSG
jgi:hypothetical protein